MVATDAEIPADTGYPRPAGGHRLPSDRGDPAVAPPGEPAARRLGRGDDPRRSRQVDPAADPEGRGARASSSSVTTDGWHRAGSARASPPRPSPPRSPWTASTTCSWRRASAATSRSGPARPPSPGGGPRSGPATSILLEARAPDGAPQAGLILYRHGERLSTVHSGDHADARRDHPGALHLLRWRAIQLAIREGRAEMDLGGVDVAGGPPRAARGRGDVGPVPAQALVRRSLARAQRARTSGPRPGSLPARAGDDAAGPRRSGGDDGHRTGRATIAELLAAAEPDGARPLGGADRAARRARGRSRAPATSGTRDRTGGAGRVEIRGVTDDSRAAAARGSCSSRCAGLHVDGHEFVARRRAAGAAAAIVDHPIPDAALPQLVVDRSAAALAEAAAWWYGDPSHRARRRRDHRHGRQDDDVVPRGGRARGRGPLDRARRHGRDPDRDGRARPTPSTLTTPGAPALQRALRAMAGDGNARRGRRDDLARPRRGPRPRASPTTLAILTNLTHEHLEFHGSWEAYRDAEAVALRAPRRRARPTRRSSWTAATWPKAAIVNADDPTAGAFVGVAQEAGARVLTYGTDPARRRPGHPRRGGRAGGSGSPSSRRAARPTLDPAPRRAGSTSTTRSPSSPLGEVLGLDPAAVRDGLASVAGVPGRMERLDRGQPFGVVVDFAHSPACLEKVLGLLAPLAAARGGGLIAVFGSAGERDVEKRRMMGRIAGGVARLVVVDRRGPPRRGPGRDPRRDRPRRGGRRPATGPRPAAHPRTGRRRSPPPSSVPGPATSSCSRARATSSRSSARTARSRTTSDRRPRRPSRRWATGRRRRTGRRLRPAMRGCLFVLVLAAVLVAAIAWFAPAPIVVGRDRGRAAGQRLPVRPRRRSPRRPIRRRGSCSAMPIGSRSSASDVDWKALRAGTSL